MYDYYIPWITGFNIKTNEVRKENSIFLKANICWRQEEHFSPFQRDNGIEMQSMIFEFSKEFGIKFVLN